MKRHSIRKTKTMNIFKRAFQKLTAINDRNWNFYLKFFPLIEKGAVLFNIPVIRKLVKKAAFLDSEKKHFTQGYIIPLNRDINYNEKYKNTVLPYSMLENIIKGSSFVAIMKKCYCRDSMKCENYPSDFGCIMAGEGARTLVKRGLAYKTDVTEALKHLDRAAQMGLVAMALWVEIEAFGMGIKDEEHYRLLEICLCCPCCCLGLRNYKKWGGDIMKRFSSIGWIAVSKDGCTACKKCVKVCPMEAITVHEDSITVSGKCIGCGLCAAACPHDAIEMVQTTPFKEKIHDYFWGFRLEV